MRNGGPFWSRGDGDIHAPAGFSTLDVVNVLGDLGLTVENDKRVKALADFLYSYQNPDGSYRYGARSSKLPCMAARIVAGLGRIGITSGIHIENSLNWFKSIQERDGGWRCATVKSGKSQSTDASNPGTTLYVLDAFRFSSDLSGILIELNLALEFLLRHWETRSPLGPCDFGIGSRFMKVEYPLTRYNLLYYVYTLSFYVRARGDARFLNALDSLSKHVESDKLRIENPHAQWSDFPFAQRNKFSILGTNVWLQIVKNMTNDEHITKASS